MVTHPLLYPPFFLIAGAGALAFIRDYRVRTRAGIMLLVTGLIWGATLFVRPPQEISLVLVEGIRLVFGVNPLSQWLIMFVNLFGVAVCLYSLSCDAVKDERWYVSYLVWLISFSSLALLAADFLLFTFCAGVSLVLLYALVGIGSRDAAHKALTVVGLGDFLFILGACIYMSMIQTTRMPVSASVLLDRPISWAAFLLMAGGALAKAGCAPFHTWIPDAGGAAPMPVMAILPASLDKLVGIYLLARVCMHFFVLSGAAGALLLLVGSVTILFAVLMALAQHDLRKLLSYHAISQVGYMVVGLGCGTALGFAGALFHMLNNALYKSGLFLTAGAVGQSRKTWELERLGGLAKAMPFTFMAAMVFSLSISGVPPLNGFASKWLLYQGTLAGLVSSTSLFMRAVFAFALLSALFGSALTLASFIKFIHAVFLGEEVPQDTHRGQVPLSMKAAIGFLASLCVLLGATAARFISSFIQPALPSQLYPAGAWQSGIAFCILGAGLLLGIIVWRRPSAAATRKDSCFVGGEREGAAFRFPATEFYRTIQEVPLLKGVYRVLDLEALDIYRLLTGACSTLSYLLFILIDRFLDLSSSIVGYAALAVSFVLRRIHTGVLDQYIVWSLAGVLILLGVFMGLR